MMRVSRLVTTGVLAPAMAGAALAVAPLALAGCSSGPGAAQVAQAYLSDWARRDWAGMRALVVSPPASFTAVNLAAVAGLGGQPPRFRPGRLVVTGSAAREAVSERVTVPGAGTLAMATTLRLTASSGRWLVRWTPATIAPQLGPGDRLSLQVSWPPRAQILGAGGAPLTTRAAMVTIGIEGQRIKAANAVRTALRTAGATASAVRAALAGAAKEPTWFEPVVTVSWHRYQQLRPVIYPVPGTVFQTISERAPASPGLGYVVGTVGPVTAQQLSTLGAPYTAQSVVGQTGLELADQKQLAGHPGATITVTDSAGARVATVATLRPRPGAPVRTSIDPLVQADAEKALAGVSKHAALVALNARTGQVLAAVSVPATAGFNLAFDGAFPPGSSFKVLTSTALIAHGLTPGSSATCPPQLTVDGEVFHNAEGTAPVTNLLHAFAESCNTAFIGLAERHLTAADFTATAAQYRLGTVPRLGLPAFGGSVPAPSSAADLAATTIGQGRVLVSPLNMAVVAAAADTGEVRAARLVAGAPDDVVPPAALPRATVRYLHEMMAQVVATGTASGRGLPPGTYAKTGTAQYGQGTPLPTDAWLVGFNNAVDRTAIAFAMVTVDGGEGGPTDGPVVAKFLGLVHQSGS